MPKRRPSGPSNWSNAKQIVVSSSLLIAIAIADWTLPSAQPYTKFLYTLPYRQPNGSYSQGVMDAIFVLDWVILLTAIRATVIATVYKFFTHRRLDSEKKRERFAEQSWLLLYYSLSFAVGMDILISSPYWFNFKELWSAWPAKEMDGNLKCYFLIQLANWMQSLLAVNLERRRKDYAQMLTHHVITCLLMYACYNYRWIKIGNVILCIMDVGDFLLPLAKMLKYLHYEIATNVAFGVFLTTWVAFRHVIYISLCWLIYRDIPAFMEFGCYQASDATAQDPDRLGSWRYMEPFYTQSGTICFDRKVKWVFLSLLLTLQTLSIIWFAIIVKIAYKLVMHGAADDSRSSDEEEEEVEEVKEKARGNGRLAIATDDRLRLMTVEPKPVQYRRLQKSGPRLRASKSKDNKELLGRVGCNGSTM